MNYRVKAYAFIELMYLVIIELDKKRSIEYSVHVV